MIKVLLNGKNKTIDDKTNLNLLLKELSIESNKVAIEINGVVVSKNDYEKKIIRTNDKIEIVHFIGGG
ncbi:MAG: sulfur carrier protein ThiS [Candidatus Fonsibacter sp.]|jgi:sulfur carrier protein|nr:sulfur carrier protein ThiS [Pelagibacterales bacterium]